MEVYVVEGTVDHTTVLTMMQSVVGVVGVERKKEKEEKRYILEEGVELDPGLMM